MKATPLEIGLAAFLLAAVGACDFLGPEDRDGSGALTISLLSPNGDEGSAVFEMVGGAGLGTVSPIGGEVFYQHLGGSSRIVVVMDDPGEVRFQVYTDDVQELPEVEILQVAGGDDELRASLAGYSVRFSVADDSSNRGGGG